MPSFKNISQDDTDDHHYVLYKNVRNILNRAHKKRKKGCFLVFPEWIPKLMG